MVVYTKTGKVPVPGGWELKRVLEVLLEAGHEPTHVEDEKGSKAALKKERAA